uniref:OCA domain-containing protein n=1 Tax=Pipistrellus kuhlii TaxID=59472 RepID=A0A7J7WYT5_PIPKU|nr:hypothetical protein mPipKuh1_001637 [Pipistrellus kuhlii]
MEGVSGDYSKRVYQGVRVKHTVKDLLAEKRSKQTSNSRFSGHRSCQATMASGGPSCLTRTSTAPSSLQTMCAPPAWPGPFPASPPLPGRATPPFWTPISPSPTGTTARRP